MSDITWDVIWDDIPYEVYGYQMGWGIRISLGMSYGMTKWYMSDITWDVIWDDIPYEVYGYQMGWGIRISHGMSHISSGLSPYDICDIPCDIRIPIDFALHNHAMCALCYISQYRSLLQKRPAMHVNLPSLQRGCAQYGTWGTFIPSRGTFIPPRGTFIPTRGTFIPSRGTFIPPRGTFIPTRGTFIPSHSESRNIHSDLRNIHSESRNIHSDSRNIHSESRNIHSESFGMREVVVWERWWYERGGWEAAGRPSTGLEVCENDFVCSLFITTFLKKKIITIGNKTGAISEKAPFRRHWTYLEVCENDFVSSLFITPL